MIKVRFLKMSPGAALPEYQSETAAGADVRALLSEPLTLQPGERRLVPTGLKMELPPGYEAQMRPRSGLAVKYGITVLNTPGTIDEDYRGELKVCLINLGAEPFRVNSGDRIGQIVFAPAARAVMEEASALSPTARGEGGFGSTGV
jgi:dUTP pyrophosphatase